MTKTLRTALASQLIVWMCLLGTNAIAQDFWKPTGGPLGQNAWEMLVTTNGTYYAGTGEGKVFRRLPGEVTWHLVFQSLDHSTITMLYEHPDGSIYVSDDQIVARSADGETSWEVIDSQNLWVRSMVVADDGRAYFGSGFGIYTIGADDKFKEVHFDSSYPFGKWIYSMMKGPDGALYAGTGRELYKTVQYDNDTIIWAKQTVLVSDPMPTYYAMAMKSNGDMYTATAFGLYANYAGDGNEEWVEVAGSIIRNRIIRTLAVGKNDRLFINFNGHGVVYSDDDTNWIEVAGTEEINTRPGIFYDAVADAMILGSWNGVWSSPEQNDYVFSKIGLPSKISAVLSDHPKLFVIEDNQHLMESSDGGDTWQLVLSFTEGRLIDFTERVNGAKYAAVWGGALGLPGILMYDEDEFGDIWFSIGLPNSVTEIYDILLNSEDILLVSTNSGLYSINPVTYDAELLWSQPDIATIYEDASGVLYASTGRGLYASHDQGKTWPVHLLEDEVVNMVAVTTASELYIATGSGLYYANNLEAEPLKLGDDDILQISQNFQSVVVDRAGHVYVICDDGIFYGETMNGPWQTRPDGLNTVKEFTRLHLYNDIVYMGTEFGLYKHQLDNQAIILLSGIGSFVYDGQVHGNPQATTIPPGLTVNITFTAGSDAGSYAVHAVIEDDFYQGEVESAVVIRKATQAISFPSVADKYNTDEAFTLQGTSNVGLPVSFQIISGPATLSTGNLITLSGEPGIVEVKATQPGSQNYFPAKPVTRIFEVLYNPITGMDDPLSKSLRVFPVPADKTLHIISEYTSLRTLTISDVTGRVLKAIQLDRDTYRHDLEVASYPAGMLLLTVTNNRGEKVTRRIQIIH